MWENKLENKYLLNIGTNEEFGLHIREGIAYESKEENGGRVVYFAFDIDDIVDPDIQQKSIQNSENWLRGGI